MRVEHHEINDLPKAPEKLSWLLKCKCISREKAGNEESGGRKLRGARAAEVRGKPLGVLEKDLVGDSGGQGPGLGWWEVSARRAGNTNA